MDSGGARRGIGHKLTTDTAMYPGSGPSGVEVKPLRPASLSLYINGGFGYKGAPGAVLREKEESHV